MFAWDKVSNKSAETLGLPIIPAPWILNLVKFVLKLYSPPNCLVINLHCSIVFVNSNSLTVNAISLLFPSWVAWIIKSTLMLASDKVSNIWAAIPGLSGSAEILNTVWFSNTSRLFTVFVNSNPPLFKANGWILLCKRVPFERVWLDLTYNLIP